MQAALENPRLTEVLVINSVLRPGASAPCGCRCAAHEVVLPQRNPRRSSAHRASLISPRLGIQPRNPGPLLHELLTASHLPAQIKDQLLREGQGSSPPSKRLREV